VIDAVSRTHRQLLAVVALLLVGTLVGLWMLWPRADALPETSEPLDDLIAGEILDADLVEGEPDEILGTSGDVVVVTVRVLEGPDEGEVVEIEVYPEGYPEFAAGDRVSMQRTEIPDQGITYFITDFQRMPVLGLLLAIFVGAVLLIGRWNGARALIGVFMSLFVVVRFIVPAILAGRSPALVALVGATAVMIITLYLAHGVNEMTTSAVIGTSAALIPTVLLGMIFIEQGKVTGFASEEANLARFAIEGLDLQGLVLAGLIIAALGVLDDVTVSQASTVFALREADPGQSWRLLFARGMKVGRDHMVSVVNTLILVYAGASLALLVLFSTGGLPTAEIVNSEIVAEEIIKTLVGSLGLIAAVPLTTGLAAFVASHRPEGAPPVGGVHAHGDLPAA
jgi:uncharacterized membrane protein